MKSSSFADDCSSYEESDSFERAHHPARRLPDTLEQKDSLLSYEDEEGSNLLRQGDDVLDDDLEIFPPNPPTIDFDNLADIVPPNAPGKPPFTAHIGNLPFEVVKEAADLKDAIEELVNSRYGGALSVKVLEARVGIDRESGKRNDFGYVEFGTIEELMILLNLNDGCSEIAGRMIRLNIAQPPWNHDTKILARRRIHIYLNEYRKLSTYFERTMIEHVLTRDHYSACAQYLNFAPLIALSVLTAILGGILTFSICSSSDHLVQTPEGIPGDSAVALSLTIGIVGTLSALVVTIGKYSEYESYSSIHRGAVKALGIVRQRVDGRILLYEQALKSDTELISHLMNGDVDKKLKEFDNLSEVHASIRAIKDTCVDSPVPGRIIEAFGSLGQYSNDGFVYDDSAMYDEVNIKRIKDFYKKLEMAFQKSSLWPISIPNINTTDMFTEWENETRQP